MPSLLRPLFCAFCAFCGQLFGSELIPALTADGFAVPRPAPTFTFPRDHGSHPDYKIEWWYLTGHLFTEEKTSPRRFGFQATFFRFASPRLVAVQPAPESFGHDQIYLAHMALIDVSTGRFLHQERLNRAGWDAAASTTTLDVRNGDWSLRLLDIEKETLALTGGIGAEARFTFTLTPVKPLVRFGDGGYSRKGSAPTAASYYLTFSRLAAAGTLTLNGQALPVSGTAWMDHEYSSSQLDAGQVGWDWLSAQLNDGREIMFYALRRADGSHDTTSTLTWIDAAGRLSTSAYQWEPLTTWQSPHTGAVYPSRIRLTTTDPATGKPAIFIIAPFHPDQELGGKLGGVTYWEGACQLLSPEGAELGSAYLELTGYDKPVDVIR
jgi:predicted secreted hydrolase